MSEQTAFCQ